MVNMDGSCADDGEDNDGSDDSYLCFCVLEVFTFLTSAINTYSYRVTVTLVVKCYLTFVFRLMSNGTLSRNFLKATSLLLWYKPGTCTYKWFC